MKTKLHLLLAVCVLVIFSAAAKGYEAGVPKPTFTEVRYGSHARNVLDFWKADSDQPTPLVFVIHGGGVSLRNFEGEVNV